MEIIRIPKVSLVDGTGKKIGVYADDPDWWQRLKQKKNKKNLSKNHQHMIIENESTRQFSSPKSIETNSSIGTGGSKVLLIDEESSHNEIAELKTTITIEESDTNQSLNPMDSGNDFIFGIFMNNLKFHRHVIYYHYYKL